MASVAEHFGDPDWFAPKADSETNRIFRAMEDVPDGGILTYADLSRVLDRDYRDNTSPWGKALRRWHREHPEWGTFENIRGVGYRRRNDWKGIKQLGKGHERKMSRQAKKAEQRYDAANPSSMSNDERLELDVAKSNITKLQSAMRAARKDILVLRREKADKSAVDELREQIAELAKKVDKT